MCEKKFCPCRWNLAETDEEFTLIFDASFTTNEEAYIDTEPDIAGPLRELDRRAREERNRRRRDI